MALNAVHDLLAVKLNVARLGVDTVSDLLGESAAMEKDYCHFFLIVEFVIISVIGEKVTT